MTSDSVETPVEVRPAPATVTVLFDPYESGDNLLGYRVVDLAEPETQKVLDRVLRNSGRAARAYEVRREDWEEFVRAVERYRAAIATIEGSTRYTVTLHVRLNRGADVVGERTL